MLNQSYYSHMGCHAFGCETRMVDSAIHCTGGAATGAAPGALQAFDWSGSVGWYNFGSCVHVA